MVSFSAACCLYSNPGILSESNKSKANTFCKSVTEIQAFIWGGGAAGLRFSDKISSWIMSNFKETAHFDENR